MSTHGQENQIDELLQHLNVKVLHRSHNSLNISFQQMLNYIDKARKSIPPGDIKNLFSVYRSMVEMFYTQFEFTLLREITKQREAKRHAYRALKCIAKLPDNDPTKIILEQANSLLFEDHQQALREYNRLKKNYPTLLQSALNKLRDEWQRLNTLVSVNQVLTGDEKLDWSLKAVVEVAAHSVGIGAERIAIVPGNTFALNFFTYLDNFAVLTVPIYSVQSLWEWSIFWHELAGYQVRRLEKSATIETIKERLIAFHKDYKVSDGEMGNRLLDTVAWDNSFCRNYLVGVFSMERPNLDDLGDFDRQFERVLLSLPSADRFQRYDQIKADGWCADWFEELFEDAWSVLTIGEPFLVFFEDILARNAVKDARHPPAKVRESVAKEILKLINPETTLKNDPNPVEYFTAQQILKFMSLLRVSVRQYKKPDMDSRADAYLSRQCDRDKLVEMVRDGIRESIEDWSREFLTADNPLRRVRGSTKDLAEALADPKIRKLISRLHGDGAKHIQASYKELLENRTHEQLLKLSFSEIDYHTPGDIQLLQDGRTYWVKPVDWYSANWSAQRRYCQAGNGTLITETIITEIQANRQTDWKVQIADWNSWFKMTQ